MTVSTIGILHDFQSRQLVGVAGIGTGQIPRAVLHADAEDSNILMMLGDAKAVGGWELAVDQIHHAFVVAVVSTKLEVGFGVIAISGLDDAKFPSVLTQNLVGVEADRIADPHYLKSTAVGTVDVGARPRLVVGIDTAVGIVRVVRIVVVRDPFLVFVLAILLLVLLAVLLLVLNMVHWEKGEQKRKMGEIFVVEKYR